MALKLITEHSLYAARVSKYGTPKLSHAMSTAQGYEVFMLTKRILIATIFCISGTEASSQQNDFDSFNAVSLNCVDDQGSQMTFRSTGGKVQMSSEMFITEWVPGVDGAQKNGAAEQYIVPYYHGILFIDFDNARAIFRADNAEVFIPCVPG